MLRIFLFLLFLFPANVFAAECTREIDSLARDYNINISCNPYDFKRGSLYNVSGKKPDEKSLKNTFSFLKEFLSSFSKEFISSHLENIYLVKDLTINEKQVAGLSMSKEIWIKSQIYYGENADFLRVVFQHEFSSNILRRNYFNVERWKGVSQDNYDYSESFFIKNINDFEFSRSSSEQLYVQGLLYNYGKTNPENDFNVYAEMLFTDPIKIKYLSSKYEIIRKKLNMLKNIYRNEGFRGKFPDGT